MPDFNNHASERSSDRNLIRATLLTYLSYWPLLIVLLVIFSALGWLYIRFVPPVYQVKASIVVKDEKKGSDESKMVESLDLFTSKKIVENEIEIIKSQSLTQEVVEKMALYAPIYREGKVIDQGLYSESPVHIVFKTPRNIRPAKKLHFKWDEAQKIVTFEGKSYPVTEWINSQYGTFKFVLNEAPFRQPVSGEYYFSVVPVTSLAEDIVNDLEVEAPNKLATVINISLKDEDEERGKMFLNELIAAYDRAVVRDKNALANNTLSFVEERLGNIEHELDSIEALVETFKSDNKIVDINTQGQLFLRQVGENDQKMGDISMQLAILEQVENYVNGKGGKGGIVPSTLGVSDPVLSSLLDKLYTAELEYEKLKTLAPENNPMLIALKDQIDKIKPSIRENIMSQRRGLLAGKSDLATTNKKYSSVLRTMPQKERELLEISRQQAIKSDIYTFLLKKREEASLAYASSVPDSRLIDSAQVSKKPVSPNKLLVIGLVLFIPFIIVFIVVSIKELFNSTIDKRAEIENLTQVPILAEFVKDRSKSALVVSEGDQSFIAEQFRQLRTTLSFLGINSKKKKILVTSSIASEGKTFISANLGISLALAHHKVALLEMDLRRPALASLFGIDGSEGISQYLNGDKDIEHIIKRCEGYKNLFIIPSGPIPPNPSELLLGGRLAELFRFLEDGFDYLIIDTTPVSPVTDAYILSPLCDATLYVMRQGVTPRAIVQNLDQYKGVRSLKNMAIVFNGVNGRDFGEYGYRQGYSYVREKAGKRKKHKAAL